MIGDHLKSMNVNETRMLCECYETAAIYYAKSKDWHRYCQVVIVHAKLLNESDLIKEASKIAGKVLSACFHLSQNEQLGELIWGR